MSERSAGGLADALSHLLQLAMLEKSGRPTDVTHRELLRDRIKQYVQTHLRDPDLSIHRIALALNCSKRWCHSSRLWLWQCTPVSSFVWPA